MRVRQLAFLKDRVRYALDKKLLMKLGWKDGDDVRQIVNGNFSLILLNKTKYEKEYGDYQRAKEILDIIAERELKRQLEYEQIKKKHPGKNSRAYTREMSKFNRGFLTEEEAIGKKKIPIKILKQRLKDSIIQKNIINAEISSLKNKIKRRKIKKASS